MNYAPLIKQSVSCRDLIDSLGIKLENNKALCPFHLDSTPSMQIYDDGFRCWSCGTFGDVIDLAEAYYGCDKKDAIIRLNQDFNLQLPIGEELSEHKRIELQRQENKRMRAKNIAELKRVATEANYWFLYDMVLKLTEQIKAFAPQNPTEPQHPLFLSALIDLPIYEYDLERVEAERTRHKKIKENKNGCNEQNSTAAGA